MGIVKSKFKNPDRFIRQLKNEIKQIVKTKEYFQKEGVKYREQIKELNIIIRKINSGIESYFSSYMEYTNYPTYTINIDTNKKLRSGIEVDKFIKIGGFINKVEEVKTKERNTRDVTILLTDVFVEN